LERSHIGEGDDATVLAAGGLLERALADQG
jgi:hypothetical protein